MDEESPDPPGISPSTRAALTSAALFLIAAACTLGSSPFHGLARGMLLGVSIVLFATGGMILGIRIAKRADRITTARLERLSRRDRRRP
ncbi:MAG: hypothetical protein BGO26_16960 [Actinobacteria bacterium 69-20]|jgi:hypothetical protein|nr:hypothetical protein [Actinomycetota bacterium]OJV27146.1 MAG: hypothetical protein BGO26_16960 [Actinobacteria bacterium 69-20]